MLSFPADTAGSNKAASGPSLNARKLEEDTDTLARKNNSMSQSAVDFTYPAFCFLR